MYNIIIGITGSIAAYKTCDLVSRLKKDSFNIRVIMTKNATEFITGLTLESLSANKVYTNMFSASDLEITHITLAKWGDLFVVAPATANFISKFANGICDDLLTSEVIAFPKKIIIAPAMNVNMYENQVIQENLNKLKKLKNIEIIEPEEGMLACGDYGKGKLANIDTIYNKIKECLNLRDILKNKNILITSGPTYEDIDDVRFITNRSTGKMGEALAKICRDYGANVTFITGPVNTKNLEKINYKHVRSAEEMLTEVLKNFEKADVFISAAAVTDFRVNQKINGKIKKQTHVGATHRVALSLELMENPDILKEIQKIKTVNQIIIGFAAETSDLIINSKVKLKEKNLDYIVANDVSKSNIGFGSDYNEVVIIDKRGHELKIPYAPKEEIAKKIVETCLIK
jgi:phosphopantothenoylcysteine decarboxylase/phosphopantothenate--cysteine ligase